MANSEQENKLLRLKAEEMHGNKQTVINSYSSEAENIKLIHELEVHQIELELQNEELKLAKQQADEARNKYSTLYDSSPTGYFTLSKNGKVLELNLCGALMLGKERLYLIGSRFSFFIQDEAKPLFNHFLNAVFAGNSIEICEVTLSTSRSVQMDVHLTGVISENEEVCLITAVDITERKQAEKDLQKSELKYRTLFNVMEEGFSLNEIITDKNGIVKDFRIIDANEAYEKHTGLKLKEIIGKTVLEIMPQVDKRQIENYAKVALTGKPVTLEYFSNAFNRHFRVKVFSPQPNHFATVFDDISERKEMEESLRESEIKYRSLIESSDDVIFCVDKKGEYLFTNQVFASAFGKTPGYFIGKTYWDIYPAEQANLRQSVTEKVFLTCETQTSEVVVALPDKTLYFSAKASPVKDDSGQISSCLVISRDITERKMAEASLQKMSSQLSNILESTLDIIAMMDTNYRYILFNSAFHKEFKRIFGKDLSVGDSMIHALTSLPEDLSAAKKYWDRAFAGEDLIITQQFGDVALERNWYELHFSPIRDNAGKVVSAVHIVRNVTERIRKEIELLESEARFRHLADTAPVLIWMSGTDALCNYFNKTWLDFTGRSEEQELGTGWAEGVHADDFQYCLKTYMTSFEAKCSFKMEYRLRNALGEYRWLLDTGVPRFTADGIFLGFIGSCVDISDRKNSEEEIKLKNEQLKSLNLERDKLFSIVAHDLRSPFQAFLGLTDLLAQEAEQLTKEQVKRFGVNMSKSANNLFGFLQNLLEWAQLQREAIDFLPKEISLTDIIAKNLDLLSESFENKEIILINLVIEPIKAFADRKMINSVILNLISNAIKFTKRRGSITIAYKKNDNGMIEISVSDNGVGIPKEIAKNLFKLGEKTGQKGTEGELSSGLGLVLCKEFVEKNGGQIWVKSEAGNGSTFYFTIPVSKMS